MQYDVYIQGKFYTTISAENTGDVLTQIAKDIAENKVDFDHTIPQNIKIEPKA